MTERNPMSQETKKGASCFCMERACLKVRPKQVGCEGKAGREREREIIPVEHLDADLSDSRNT